jgi:hypothetical protein
MAIHAKKIQVNGSSNMVSFTGNIGATELQVTESDGVTLYDPEFRTIEAVHNFSGGNVTFGGFTFAAGAWKFGEVGGLKMATTQQGAISGNNNCLITLRT